MVAPRPFPISAPKEQPFPERESMHTARPALLTVDQVANLLQCSARTIWRLRSSGQIPTPLKLAGSIRWRRTDIETWIAQGCPEPPTSDNNRRRN